MKVILEKSNTAEVRAISQYTAICDGIEVIRCEYDDLRHNLHELKDGAMPVGSVEFVRRAMQLIGIDQPEFNPYPDDMPYARGIRKRPAYHLFSRNEDTFIKPVQLKRFNGFVYRGMDGYAYDDHDLEQLKQFMKFRLDDEIYMSNVVNFVAEWRCYYLHGELLAVCRYDDGDDEYIEYIDEFISSLQKYVNNATMAVDIGVLDNEKYCVIECNDAWAIGKYDGISNKHYFEFLSARWDEIINSKVEK